MKVSRFIAKTAAELFDCPESQRQFAEALAEPKPRARAVVWCKTRPDGFLNTQLEPAPFQPEFVDCFPADAKLGSLPEHDSGHYYCLDLSSVFAASVLTAIESNLKLRVLDICAAPGGKSVLALQYLSPEHLVCNDAVRKRCSALIGNLRRCQIAPVSVLSVDTAVIAERLAQCFDVVLVDAPCSGQSLLAKGKTPQSAFHPATVNLNGNRQRRILSNSAKAVSPGGYLAYMTCTYAVKENEKVLEWFLKRNPDFSACHCPLLANYRSTLSAQPCYRLLPQQGQGAGAFTALLKRATIADSKQTMPNAIEQDSFYQLLDAVPPIWSTQ